MASESDERDEDCLRAEQRLGQVLRGKYRLDRVLGVGGMAAVYAATHRNQKQFAVKVLHAELSLREDIRTRFLREGYAANSVKHPGAVAVLDDDVAEDGAAFLVMELLDGLSMEQLAEQHGGRLGVAYVLAIAHQLLDALAAAHGNGIVHRDLKPANLFVSREGQVKVLDFGIARVRDAATSGAHATGTGMLLGTPAFMAPEQAMGKSNEIDAQTDLWAVGATLFTVLSGQLVHEGETGPHLMILAATTPARPLLSVAPEIPQDLAKVVDHSLAFRKADRWPSAEAMRDAVRDASLAMFGRLPLRETLVPLFDDRPDGLARTRLADDETGRRPPTAGTTPPLAPDGGTSANRPAHAAAMPAPARTGHDPRWAPVYGSPVGLTTSQPVSNDAPISLPAGVPRARPLVLGIVVAAGMLVVAGSVAVGFRSLTGRSGAAEAAPSAEPSTSTALGEPPQSAGLPASAQAPVPTVPPIHLAQSAQAANLAASSPVSLAPPPSGEPAAGAAKPVANPTGFAKGRPAPAAAASTTASAPPVCRLVSFFDGDGNKHFRQECR